MVSISFSDFFQAMLALQALQAFPPAICMLSRRNCDFLPIGRGVFVLRLLSMEVESHGNRRDLAAFEDIEEDVSGRMLKSMMVI